MNKYFLVVSIILLSLFDVKSIITDFFNFDAGKVAIIAALILAGGFYYFHRKTEQRREIERQLLTRVSEIESRVEENSMRFCSLEQRQEEIARSMERIRHAQQLLEEPVVDAEEAVEVQQPPRRRSRAARKSVPSRNYSTRNTE